MAKYELWYTDPLGKKISYIPNVAGFNYVKVLGDVGIVQFDSPVRDLVHEENIPDRRIMIYRQAVGGAQQLEAVAFLDKFIYSTDRNGLDRFAAEASDLNVLLKRRIVAYTAGTARADYDGSFTSNQMSVVASENLGPTATDTAREIDSYGFSVADDISAGPDIDKQAAWRNCLTLLQDMQAFSKQADDEVFFAITPTSETDFHFRTYSNQFGSDRTLSTGFKPVIFSLERGNLLNPSLTYDYSKEANYVYAGGQGLESDRIIQEAEDTDATGLSPFARKEVFHNATNHALEASVLDAAQDKIIKSRAKTILGATLVSTPSIEYGLDWFFGDKVSIDYQDIQVDAVIRAVAVSVDGNGRETVQARVEADV